MENKKSKEEINRIFEENRKLVFLVLNKEFKTLKQTLVNIDCNFSFEDVIQEGYIGLFKAIKSFDESKKYAFSTYAYKCIKVNIIGFLNQTNIFNSRRLGEILNKIKSRYPYNDLSKITNDELELISSEMKYSKEAILAALNSHICVSLDAPLNPINDRKSNTTLKDMIVGTDNVESDIIYKLENTISELLTYIKESFNEQYYNIFYDYFIKKKTYQEIANEIGISRQAVSLKIIRMKDRIKNSFKITYDKDGTILIVNQYNENMRKLKRSLSK